MISLLLIVYSWKPYFLYKKGFEDNIWEYVWHYAKYLSLLLLACVASDYVLEHYARLESQSFVQWSISGMKAIVIYAFISLLLLYGLDQSARNFVRRFGGIVKR